MRAQAVRLRGIGLVVACGGLASIIALAAFACSTELDVSGGGSDPGADGAADAAAADGALPPPVDIDANVADCGAGERSEPLDAIHVTPTGASAGSCGTRAQPCSLARALEIARTDNKPSTVLVSSGAYQGDLELSPDLRIEGGWFANPTAWQPICDQRVVFVSGATYATVRAIDTPNVTIALLTILGSQTPIAVGETRFGIFARGPSTMLSLESVAIVGGGGGVGPAGGNGESGDGGGPTDCTGSNGQDGTAGAIGTAGTLSILADGGISATGTPGGVGMRGNAGTAGGTGVPTLGGKCSPLGGSACQVGGMCFQPQQGFSGCGGWGGGGGGPGRIGGGSIGIFASDSARVIVSGGACGSSAAGAGGQGGAGGPGAPGHPGRPGATVNVACAQNATQDCQREGVACVTTTFVDVVGGTAGGPGGRGGAGGQGAGGMGGPSFGVVEISGGTVDTSRVGVLSFGAGGAAGLPGGAPGKAAQRGP